MGFVGQGTAGIGEEHRARCEQLRALQDLEPRLA
jgi:hypothetical protein